MARAKILTLRFESGDDSQHVNVEFGTKSIQCKIPKGEGVIRVCAIFNDKGDLDTAELVTDKS